ncbi:MAG: response regulator transcription factor [Bacteroidota bacterium]
MKTITNTIAFAEDDLYWHNELLFALKNNPQFKVLFHVWNGNELMEELRSHKPDILIVDFFMPVLCGNEAIIIIKKEMHEIKILGINVNYQNGLINDLRNAGMNGFAIKNQGVNEILSAIDIIKAGESYFNAVIENISYDKEIDNQLHDHNFTPSEITILRRSSEGKSSKEIGIALYRSSRTIESHIESAKQKFKVSKLSEAIAKAISLGLIPPPHL